jgi:uncharacterized protein YhfF
MRNFELGFRGTDLRRRLVAAVLAGRKTATASLRSEYEPTTEEPMPYIGERCRLVGYDDEVLGIVETIAVDVVPAGEVDLDFAAAEGEGFESVQDWRAAHERFWADTVISDETEIVCERFRLIEVFGAAST